MQINENSQKNKSSVLSILKKYANHEAYFLVQYFVKANSFDFAYKISSK